MLPKRLRLTVEEVKSLFDDGKTAKTLLFFIHYLPRKEKNGKKAAIVPKKIFKKAHDRNRIRRILYVALEQSGVGENVDMLLMVRSARVSEMTLEQLTEEIRKIQL